MHMAKRCDRIVKCSMCQPRATKRERLLPLVSLATLPAVALANSPEDGAEEDALVISDKEGLRGAFGDLKAATGAALEVKAELVEACAASRSAPRPLRPVAGVPAILDGLGTGLAAVAVAARSMPLQEFPTEAPPADFDEDKHVLTICADGESTLRPDLLQNTLSRVRERAQVISYFVDGNGWLWMNVGTEAQGRRAHSRIDSIVALGGAVALRCHMTAPSDWPSGHGASRRAGGAGRPQVGA